MKAFFVAIFILLFTVSLAVSAASPLNFVQVHVNNVLDVLKDPSLKGEPMQKAKKERIRSISEKMFDFTELSRRALANNWSALNAVQQKEFVDLFKEVLEDAYVDRIMSYSNEKIVFQKEISMSEKTSEVQTVILARKAEIPINYRVIMKDGGWRVYDVVIEGVSLVSNYRSQFRDILKTKSPEDLIEVLRKKVNRA